MRTQARLCAAVLGPWVSVATPRFRPKASLHNRSVLWANTISVTSIDNILRSISSMVATGSV